MTKPAAYYRDLAEETRARGDGFVTLECRRIMFEIAGDYERIGFLLEKSEERLALVALERLSEKHR